MLPLRSAVLTMSMAACAVAPAVASADGLSSSTKPEDAIAQAKTALGKVSNLALSGTETDKDGSSVKLSGVVTASGPADVVLTSGGRTAHVIALPRAVYVKANAAYWKANLPKKEASLASRLAGKWIKEAAKEGADATSLFSDTSPKRAASCLDSHVGTLTNKGEKTVAGGGKVIVIADAGDKPGTAPGEIWLDEKTGLPVRQTQTGPAKAGGTKDAACDDDWPSTTKTSSYTLSKFGKAPKVVAPRHAVSPKQAVGSGGGDGGSTPV
jgi:outer membrane lipoprotein-sorting protein